jgi:APA family basic amino acid/polyamine antiporter
METLKKKYGLFTAVAMVVGVVIGSGVFFKADDVLMLTEGNLILGLIAWGLGAVAMIFGALVFADYAHRIEKTNGVVDYSEAAYGKKAGYLVGWFNWILYFSPLTAILAWVSARYTVTLFKLGDSNPMMVWYISIVYLLLIYVINSIAPKIAGDLQVGTTIIKLIPLVLIAIVGIIYGIIHGMTYDNFLEASYTVRGKSNTLASAVVASAFAYEGWIVAITINNEIKDSKKNLPRALAFGTIIVFLVYITYFLGIAGVLPTTEIVNQGDEAVTIVANILFGPIAAVLLTAFVVISCLGTLNGLVLANIRGPYALAIRGQGPLPKVLAKVNQKFQMPLRAAFASGIVSFTYLFLWYASLNNLFGRFIAIDEIPIVLVYGIYIFLYVYAIRKFEDLGFFSRIIKPIIAILGAMTIVYGGLLNPSIGVYLFISLGVLLFGLLFYKNK